MMKQFFTPSRIRFASAAWLLLFTGLSLARVSEKAIQLPPDNPASELKPGEGATVVRADCVACHSTDYIVRQPGQDAQHWEAEVRKMMTVFGAPVNEPDIQVIVRYLVSAYGPVLKQESPKPKQPERKRGDVGRQLPEQKTAR